MNPYLDGAIIIDCTNSSNMSGERAQVIRPLAPMAIHHEIVKRDYSATLFDYFYDWDNDTLLENIVAWCKSQNVTNPLLLSTSLFNQFLISKGNKLYDFVNKFKQHFPNSKYFTGGPIAVLDPDCDIVPDAVFRGRSLHLFTRWLDTPHEPLLNTITVKGDCTVYHRTGTDIVEKPIVPILYDDYCLTENDIVSFETRLGCKFNCTFCNFEFRNAKNTHDADPKDLQHYFETAKNKYGIQHFSCVDDTFNEDDVKIENLLSAVTQLDYQPKIIGYTRFDLLKARPHQAEMLDRCGFHGHYFGIETLHREASKRIRKGIERVSSLNYLEELREKYPHWWICSGYIVGLPPEPIEHVLDVWEELTERKLLDSAIIQPLGVYAVEDNELNYAEINKNPEKFGITIKPKKPGSNDHILDWEHGTMNFKQASIYSRRLSSNVFKKGITMLDSWEAVSRRALGLNDLLSVEGKQQFKEQVLKQGKKFYYSDKFYASSNDHVTRYIKLKQDYISSL